MWKGGPKSYLNRMNMKLRCMYAHTQSLVNRFLKDCALFWPLFPNVPLFSKHYVPFFFDRLAVMQFGTSLITNVILDVCTCSTTCRGIVICRNLMNIRFMNMYTIHGIVLITSESRKVTTPYNYSGKLAPSRY